MRHHAFYALLIRAQQISSPRAENRLDLHGSAASFAQSA
jgi:hypothetical protein